LEQVGAVEVVGEQVQALRRSYATVGWTEAAQIEMAEQLREHLETHLNNFQHPDGTEHLLCRRVFKQRVREKEAKILARDLRSQIESQFTTFYDRLHGSPNTASAVDATSKHLSVCAYITLKASAALPSEQERMEPNRRNHRGKAPPVTRRKLAKQ
jgi:hypothetical protein